MKKHLTKIIFILALSFSAFAQVREYASTGGTGVMEFSQAGPITQPSWVTANPIPQGSALIVQYTVAANTDYHKRTGTITVAGQSLTINQAGKSTVVSSASYSSDRISVGGFVSIFGVDLTSNTGQCYSEICQGVTVTLTNFTTKAQAKLIYVSPSQVNAILPADFPAGTATIIVESGLNKVSDTINLRSVAPEVFSLNERGTGAIAGTLQMNRENSTSYFPLDASGITFGSNPDSYYLLLYGAGIRNQNANLPDYALIGGEQYPIIYAGAQGQYEGLDQIAIPLPPTLAHRGQLTLQVFIDGIPSNATTIVFP